MNSKEFLKGWTLLIAQPWGRRYEGDSEVARAQREFYYSTFKGFSGEVWFQVCCALAAKSEWPSVGTIMKLIQPSQHPGVEQAWAMIAPKVSSDTPTVFATEEMREAYGAALALEGDMIAARMAFKETYGRLIEQADANGTLPKWSMMPGTDPRGREAAIREAVQKKLIPVEWAMRQLPVEAHESLLALAGGVKRIT